jgi:hypothetical protein
MTSDQIQHEILEVLCKDARPLDQFQVGASIGQAPFRVRAELRVLKRLRLVRDTHTGSRHAWELTAAGYADVYTARQEAMRV